MSPSPSKGPRRHRRGCYNFLALFPEGMVCGFRPADRSPGGRGETQLCIGVASQTTHSHTHTDRKWLFCCFSWITQPVETHSVTLTFHTRPHVPEKDTPPLRDDYKTWLSDKKNHPGLENTRPEVSPRFIKNSRYLLEGVWISSSHIFSLPFPLLPVSSIIHHHRRWVHSFSLVWGCWL